MASEAGSAQRAPAALPGLPPRTVRRRPGRGGLRSRAPLAVWLLGLAGLALLLLALWLAGSPLAVSLFGSAVPGEVTGLTPPAPGTGDDPRVQFTYHVGTQPHTGEAAVDPAALARLYPGARVTVKVLRPWPDSPRLVQPAGRSGAGAVCLLAAALLWNAAALAVLGVFRRRARAQRQLVQEGVATAGQVVGKELAGGRLPGRVEFTYRAPARGPAGEGDAPAAEREWQVVMAVGRRDFEAAQVGAAVTVLYDPRQPSRSLIYPFADYEAVAPGPG